MIDGIDLDHVALAAERQTHLWPRYAGDLGGRWVQGGATRGFTWGQVGYANGMKVEVLEPFAVDQNDFLRRFLDRHGPGAHHFTYKVRNIVAALDEARAAGYEPVSVNIANPWWKEAFLHPKSAPGIVVQLAQSRGDATDATSEEAEQWEDDEEEWSEPPFALPAPRTQRPARLATVVHAVAALEDATRLFVDLLGGVVAGDGSDGEASWVEVGWPGPGRIRFVSPESGTSHLASWLGPRAGRLHHLVFVTESAGELAGAKPLADGVHEVAAADNHGVGLVLGEREDVSAQPRLGT